MEEFQG
nr:maturase K [Luffa aegyptiaca]UTQ75098.1 maturase K [Luffa aegyptiaca]